MARSLQPTYVSDRSTGVIHIEEAFACEKDKDRVSVTRCGRQLNFDKAESGARIFHLRFSDLFRKPCGECGNG